MAVMMGNLYTALKAAGVDDDKAQGAAEELPGYEQRFSRLESEAVLIRWMIGFNIALTVAVLGKLFIGH